MNLYAVTFMKGQRTCYVSADSFHGAIKKAYEAILGNPYTQKEAEIEGVVLIADRVATEVWEQRIP